MRKLGLDEETCDMYDNDKVGQSAISELARSKNKEPINPFPEGVSIMKKLHDQAKYFESSIKNSQNYNLVLKDNPTLLVAKIKRDLNGTQMSAVYNLVRSSIHTKPTLVVYFSRYHIEPYLTEAE